MYGNSWIFIGMHWNFTAYIIIMLCTKFECYLQYCLLAIVIGKLNYALALLCNSTKAQLQKLNTLSTKTCRTIMGNP